MRRDAPADAGEPAVTRLLVESALIRPGAVGTLVGLVAEILGARGGRLFVADYSMRRLQQVDDAGAAGEPITIANSLAGRAFVSDDILVSGADPVLVSIPLMEGTDRIGLLELDFDGWSDSTRRVLDPLVTTFVLLLVATGRYSDQWARARRSEALSAAAEIQWDLLPPLSCSTDEAAVGGILEPAYAIGGDSFDYAFNDDRLEFAIVDAIGHGMPAVLMSASAINSLRHARRAGADVETAYRDAGALIAAVFGDDYYVTAQLGSLQLATGVLTWINAGHVPPMLVRNGTYAGELQCTPSKPLGLGGPVVEVGCDALQRGDRVLFYTDGITESRSPDGTFFGQDRLADFLVRASLERVPAAETARRLSANVVEYVGAGLKDDATLLLIDYIGPRDPGGREG